MNPKNNQISTLILISIVKKVEKLQKIGNVQSVIVAKV